MRRLSRSAPSYTHYVLTNTIDIRQYVLANGTNSMLARKKPVLWASQLPELAPQVAKKKGLFASMKSEIKATMTTITMSHTGKFS